jgi:DnaJ domain
VKGKSRRPSYKKMYDEHLAALARQGETDSDLDEQLRKIKDAAIESMRALLPEAVRHAHRLNLTWPFSEDELDAAYRKLALVHHPDRGGDDKAMAELNEAYRYLGDLLRTR